MPTEPSAARASEADRYWRTPRRFFIPAFSGSLDDLLQLAAGLTQKPPEITSGKAADFEPVILAPQDVPGLVEFLVMSIEAERKDSLKQLSVSAELGEPELWILPRLNPLYLTSHQSVIFTGRRAG